MAHISYSNKFEYFKIIFFSFFGKWRINRMETRSKRLGKLLKFIKFRWNGFLFSLSFLFQGIETKLNWIMQIFWIEEIWIIWFSISLNGAGESSFILFNGVWRAFSLLISGFCNGICWPGSWRAWLLVKESIRHRLLVNVHVFWTGERP